MQAKAELHQNGKMENPEIRFGSLFTDMAGDLSDFKIADFIPAHNAILAAQAPAELVTKGGILIPEGAEEPRNIAVILKVGSPDCPYRVGDVVLHRPQNGGPRLEGRKDLILLEWRGDVDDDILGVLNRPSAKNS